MANLLRPCGRLLLTTPYKYYRRVPFEALSLAEDGGHVRWGYTLGEMKQLFADTGLVVIEEGYVTGPLSQWLIRIQRILMAANLILGWVVVFPFRWIVVFDSLLTRITRFPSLSIAVVGEKA
jgi:hypothetical protein